jgi:hypothetical protein
LNSFLPYIGFAALLPVLYDAKVYYGQCDQTLNNETYTSCIEQTVSLVNVASVAV